MTTTPSRTRRSLLKGLGALTVTTLAPTALTGAQAARTSGPSGRVGVLLPAASAHARLSGDFLAGLQLALHAPGHAAVPTVTAALPARPADLPATIAALRAQDVTLVVALGDDPTGRVADAADAHDLPLVTAEVGALLPRGAAARPGAYRVTLDRWAAEWAHGAHLARAHPGARTVLALSAMEAGYDLPYAFVSGAQSAGGAVQTVLLDPPGHGLDLSAALNAVRDLRPGAVHLLAHGQHAAAFLRAYPNLGPGRAPLSVGGLNAGTGAAYAATWHAGLATPGTRDLLARHARTSGTHHHPTALTALGYDTGAWIAAALHQPGGTLTDRLAQATAHGTRGELRLDRRTGLVGTCFPVTLGAATLPAAPRQHPALTALHGVPRSGWSTPYLHA